MPSETGCTGRKPKYQMTNYLWNARTGNFEIRYFGYTRLRFVLVLKFGTASSTV